MTLYFLEMPNDSAPLAKWLEDRLSSGSLGELVAELSAVHPLEKPHTETLESLLGSRLNDVLVRGLSVLPEAMLRGLVRAPWLLLDLQEKIFLDGGTHWSHQTPTADEREQRDRVWSKVAAEITGKPEITGEPRPAQPLTQKPSRPAISKQKSRHRFTPWILAATVLVGAWLLRSQVGNVPGPAVNPQLQTSCGWTLPGALKQDSSRDDYLQSLMAGADDWFQGNPRNSAELAQRIEQFQQGCAIVLAAEHQPLPAADREWLIEKCAAWSKKLGGHLADLNAGGNFETVKKAADETIRSLIEKLRERATAVPA